MENEGNQQRGSGGFMTAYRLSGESKITGSFDFIEILLEAGAKFLLFAHHIAVLDKYEAYFQKKKTGCVRIDGRIKPEIRHKRV